MTADLYEKCKDCHLFVERNSSVSVAVPWDQIEDDEWRRLADAQMLAPWEHLHRGDEPDTLLDESHEAWPSGQKATLSTWREFGPLPMIKRFWEAEHHLV